MKTDEIEEVLAKHLEGQEDIEIILLKGHLILEQGLNELLSVYIADRGRLESLKLTFARKLELLVALYGGSPLRAFGGVKHLKELNRIRNKLAHELDFHGYHDDLKRWACEVLQYTPKTINRKRTYRNTVQKAFYAIAGYMSGVASMAQFVKNKT